MFGFVPFTGLEAFVFLALGALAGFLGGLIGIGGGFVLVPGLYFVFSHNPQLSGSAMPLTLGTTMACIIFTATGTVLAQLRRGAVALPVVKRFTPYVVPGCILGTLLATSVDGVFVRWGFAAFCLYSATRMMFFSKTIAKQGACIEGTHPALPATFFGTLCGMLGVGGANLFVPFMMKRNVDARAAMGTASALQLPISIAGTLAFIVNGWGLPLPAGSLGFVYLPALAFIVVASMTMAPLGVRATHALPVATVKKVFAGFTALAGLKMMGILPF